MLKIIISLYNNIENIEFICGDVEDSFENLIKKQKIQPSLVIIDPPRKGLDNNTIQNIINLDVKKVIYISCNPATLVRDLKLFEKNYKISDIQPVDMFPQTFHVETCVLLSHKKSQASSPSL